MSGSSKALITGVVVISGEVMTLIGPANGPQIVIQPSGKIRGIDPGGWVGLDPLKIRVCFGP